MSIRLPERFADLHCHPAFKAVLMEGRGFSAGRSAWDDVPISMGIMRSQSNLRQLHDGRVKLVSASLYGLERAFARSELLDVFFRLNGPLDGPFFRAIRRGDHGYHDLMHMDLAALQRFPAHHDGSGRRARVLDSFAEYDPRSPDVQLVLNLEGGHNLFGREGGEDDARWETIRRNLDFFKQPGNPRLLYITLTHLARSPLGNHCYGVKLVRDHEFFPDGKGLSPLGMAFVREALSTTAGRRRILIDTKHLSLQARIDLYRLRKEEYDDDPFPLLCTHGGVTGISFTEAFRYIDGWYRPPFQRHINVRYRKPRWIEGAEFNPWSVNLYNEDIAEILASGGLIGLSLDERILGHGHVAMERMSPLEAFRPARVQMTAFDDRDDEKGEPLSLEGSLKQFCANLLHIIRVGAATPGVADPWQHVCIGSDFDGLVDPVNGCESADKLGWLVHELARWLPAMAAKANMPMTEEELERRLEGLFHANLERFLARHFV